MSEPERFTLANRDHFGLFVGLLIAQGSMCPKCGHGTRVTSKRWAKCKKCGERVERRSRATEQPTEVQPQ